jgi:hypothetical protein
MPSRISGHLDAHHHDRRPGRAVLPRRIGGAARGLILGPGVERPVPYPAHHLQHATEPRRQWAPTTRPPIFRGPALVRPRFSWGRRALTSAGASRKVGKPPFLPQGSGPSAPTPIPGAGLSHFSSSESVGGSSDPASQAMWLKDDKHAGCARCPEPCSSVSLSLSLCVC